MNTNYIITGHCNYYSSAIVPCAKHWQNVFIRAACSVYELWTGIGLGHRSHVVSVVSGQYIVISDYVKCFMIALF